MGLETAARRSPSNTSPAHPPTDPPTHPNVGLVVQRPAAGTVHVQHRWGARHQRLGCGEKQLGAWGSEGLGRVRGWPVGLNCGQRARRQRLRCGGKELNGWGQRHFYAGSGGCTQVAGLQQQSDNTDADGAGMPACHSHTPHSLLRAAAQSAGPSAAARAAAMMASGSWLAPGCSALGGSLQRR